MNEVEILVHGNHEFIFQAINGIARLTTNDGTLVGISATVLVLYLAWGFFKQMMDENAPYPLKEFALGIIMWTFLASPITPKFDVKVISAQDPGLFGVVDDVPLLAALPAWLATSALSSLREVVEDTFMPVVYSGGSGEIDPLSALVKMYNSPPPSRIIYGSTASEGYDLQKTMNNYIKDCYIADHELDGREPESPIVKMRNTELTEDFIDAIRVSYNGLPTDIYLDENGSSFGTRVSCPDAFNAIKLTLQSATTQNLLEDYFEDKGVRQAAVRDSIALIQGSFGSGVTSYDLQIGLLQSYLVRDGLVGTSYETEVDAMVFQAMRSRVYEKAGEREVFSQISTPVITALESLTFFIYPLYAVLIVLGGMGVKHIGKYMTLLLFINLWGFVKVFVDFYTAISVEQAFEASATFSPLSFDALPSTILEVEGYLATASMLTTTIPMICMFLLFGGVHSLMGTMKGMTQAKVDGNMGAPTVATSMNAGTRTFADATQQMTSTTGGYSVGHSNLTNSGLGTETLSSVGSTASSATTTAAASQVQTNAQNFEESFAKQVNTGKDVQAINQESSAQEIANSSIDQRVKGLSEALKKEFGMSSTDATKTAIRLGGEMGIGVPKAAEFLTPLSGKVSVSAGNETGTTFEEKWADMKSFATNWQSSITSKFEGSEKDSLMEQYSNTQRFSNSESNSELEKQARALQTSINRQAAIQDVVSDSSGFTSTQNIQWNKASSNENLQTDDYWNMKVPNGSGETYGDMLKDTLGVQSATEFRALGEQADGGNFRGDYGSDAGAFQTAIKKLLANDGGEDLGRQQTDLALAASMYQFVGSKMSGEDDNGFNLAANSLNERAAKIGDIATENENLKSLTDTKVPFEKMRQVDTTPLENTTSGKPVDEIVSNMQANASEETGRDVEGNVASTGAEITSGLKDAEKYAAYTPVGAARDLAGKVIDNMNDGVNKIKQIVADEEQPAEYPARINLPDFKTPGINSNDWLSVIPNQPDTVSQSPNVPTQAFPLAESPAPINLASDGLQRINLSSELPTGVDLPTDSLTRPNSQFFGEGSTTAPAEGAGIQQNPGVTASPSEDVSEGAGPDISPEIAEGAGIQQNSGVTALPSQTNLENTIAKTGQEQLFGIEAAQESARTSVTQDENGYARLEKDPYGNFTASDGSSYEPVGDIVSAEGEYIGEGYRDSVGNYYAYQYGQFVDMGMDDPTKNSF
ncbi:conjugal transfer protein TraG N-terminal domain-containing protein [Alteromonas gilva]|uniref:Conjugal transfer protein TraG N-terminal domain-containing protein n=1 Tax=Alteromonas gilva TaxID=2987522 RepID=A0ABT5L8R1_9ALTE|nr:conjugal transfer protein TraG N-terminal domain-containing protein [Alteromonas gilva]MDC8832866.1 conjugal transfer protein TraG N-terminal domain-containing protein [Alteromonas gilva]